MKDHKYAYKSSRIPRKFDSSFIYNVLLMAIPFNFLKEKATIKKPQFTQDENCMSKCTDVTVYEKIKVCIYNIKNTSKKTNKAKREERTKMRVWVPPAYTDICPWYKIDLRDCLWKYMGLYEIEVARPVAWLCWKCSHWELDVKFLECREK